MVVRYCQDSKNGDVTGGVHLLKFELSTNMLGCVTKV